MLKTMLPSTKWLRTVTSLVCAINLLSMVGCAGQITVLPKAGPRAVPNIQLPDRPVPTPLTEEEYNKIPLAARGKVLKFTVDWKAWADMADAAIKEYRAYIESLVGGTE